MAIKFEQKIYQNVFSIQMQITYKDYFMSSRSEATSWGNNKAYAYKIPWMCSFCGLKQTIFYRRERLHSFIKRCVLCNVKTMLSRKLEQEITHRYFQKCSCLRTYGLFYISEIDGYMNKNAFISHGYWQNMNCCICFKPLKKFNGTHFGSQMCRKCFNTFKYGESVNRITDGLFYVTDLCWWAEHNPLGQQDL